VIELGDEYLLGIDIGTYESKGVLARVDGQVVGMCAKPHDLISTQPGWFEHDAEGTWWDDFCYLSKRLINEAGIAPNLIAAVGCSTIGPCVLPLDRQNQPLRNAILYGIDTRSADEIEYLEVTIGKDEVFKRTGNDLSSQAAGPKILWIRNHEPQVYNQASLFVSGTTFLVGKLTGNWLMDHYTASTFVPLYDFHRQSWSNDFCREIISPAKLPEIAWTSQVGGAVTSTAAEESGLSAGTPVIVGTVDAASEAVSVGAVSSGCMMLMYGSTAFMILVTEKPLCDPRVWSAPFLFPGSFALMAGMATSGTLTRWFRDNFARELMALESEGGESAFKALANEASRVPAGSEGLIILPYFSGERTPINDTRARGVFYGLTLNHSRAHLYRAVLEAVGYGIRHHLEVFAEIGADVQSIRAVGGGVKNPLWLQIVGDICRVPQEISKVSVGACYGDAFLAGLGVGAVGDAKEISTWVQPDDVVSPQAEHSAMYGKQYRQYRELYARTRPLMHGEDGLESAPIENRNSSFDS
jgi:xylulokinase